MADTRVLYRPGLQLVLYGIAVDTAVFTESEVPEQLEKGWFKTLAECDPNAKKPDPARESPAEESRGKAPTKEDLLDAKLDSQGTPWHEALHAKSQSKNSDGTWRKRNGLSDEDLAAGEAELRAIIAG